MLAISELALVSRVPAVAVPPLVAAQAPLVGNVATDVIRVHALSPAVFRNHSATGGLQASSQQSYEKQTVPARHIDRFG